MVPLGELVDFYSGGTPSKARPEYWGGLVPWFSAKDMKRPVLKDSQDHVSESVFTQTPLRLLPAGTITLVVRGMILAHTVPICVLGVDGAVNQDIRALIPKRELDPFFLAAMLRAQHARLLSLVSAAAHGTKKLDRRVLEQVAVPFPPIDEQRRTAAVLERADGLRAQRCAVAARLAALASAVLQSILSEASGSRELVDFLDEGPKNGLYKPSREYGSGTPIVRIDSFKFGSPTIDLARLRRLRATPEEISEFGLREGDLLVNRVNSPQHVGKTALVPSLQEPVVFESNMMRVRVDPERMEPVFLAHFMQTADVRRQVAPMTKHAVNQASINQTDVRTIRVPDVSIETQRQFARTMANLDVHRRKLDRAASEGAALLASLQARAFRGEL